MSAGTMSRPDPAASPPWPLAVGVLLLPGALSAAARSEHRLALALGAYRFGYFLLDLVEVDGGPACAGVTGWAAVERLVHRAAADAVVVRNVAPATLPGRLPDTLTALPLRLLAD